jgi:hypothetical protein
MLDHSLQAQLVFERYPALSLHLDTSYLEDSHSFTWSFQENAKMADFQEIC